MAKTAKAAVNFNHEGVWYGPDFEPDVPADVAKDLGDHLFVKGDEPSAEQVEREMVAKATSGGAPSDLVGVAPNRKGPGSSKQAWRQYAEDNHVDVAEDASHDDIVAACEKAGLPVGE